MPLNPPISGNVLCSIWSGELLDRLESFRCMFYILFDRLEVQCSITICDLSARNWMVCFSFCTDERWLVEFNVVLFLLRSLWFPHGGRSPDRSALLSCFRVIPWRITCSCRSRFTTRRTWKQTHMLSGRVNVKTLKMLICIIQHAKHMTEPNRKARRMLEIRLFEIAGIFQSELDWSIGL